MNYTADFLWLGRCKGKLATSLRLRGAALKAFVEVGTSAAVRAVLQRASRPDASGLREELGGQPFEVIRTQLKQDAEVRDESWQQIVLSREKHWQQVAREEHWEQVVVTMEGLWQDVVQQNRREDQEWRSRWWECVEGWRSEAAALVVSEKFSPEIFFC